MHAARTPRSAPPHAAAHSVRGERRSAVSDRLHLACSFGPSPVPVRGANLTPSKHGRSAPGALDPHSSCRRQRTTIQDIPVGIHRSKSRRLLIGEGPCGRGCRQRCRRDQHRSDQELECIHSDSPLLSLAEIRLARSLLGWWRFRNRLLCRVCRLPDRQSPCICITIARQ